MLGIADIKPKIFYSYSFKEKLGFSGNSDCEESIAVRLFLLQGFLKSLSLRREIMTSVKNFNYKK